MTKTDDTTSADDIATVTLSMEKVRKDVHRPVIHVLMSDGRVTEFRERAFAMTEVPHPDQQPNDGRIYAVFVDSNGTPYVNDEGQVPMVAVPVVHLGAVHDPEEPLSWKQVAERAGVSLSTVKRAVDAGDIPRPLPVPGMERAVRFKADDVHAWLKGEIARTKKRRR
ncbi:excisionase family DNA-binding protein [Hyphomicrobium sp. CS1GBMeth3]|uniref:helix-turn-helix transcriptional regulator n=1 Tax=Hyphomicrobium sp. CS1GBMeth3 TaxID=1892845 RepID=UPI000930F273|nr:excisionase family DNA-binding protein [Hyphomicrobium sp. CS1GBMeth3]